MQAQELALRRIRLSACIGMIALLYEYFSFLFGDFAGFVSASSVPEEAAAYDDMAGFYWVLAFFGAAGLLGGFLILWFCSLPIFTLASTVIHFILGGTIPLAEWNNATFRALWTFPYAAGLGVTVWLVYSVSGWGGWPGDVIFGSIGNAIGAWCYLTIFLYWFKLRGTRDAIADIPANLDPPQSPASTAQPADPQK